MNVFISNITRFLMSAAALLSALVCHALPTDHYVSESVLATGKWAKVKVSSPGINLITDAQLRNMGFTNPEKVHVFGMGGRQLNYGLWTTNSDDLPLLPSVRTAKGLLFFATDHFSWKINRSTTRITPYTHSINQYSDDTYYFVSDIEVEDATIEAASTSAVKASETQATFIERIVHESELEPAGEMGNQVWGEDFRSRKNQTFAFELPDMADQKASVCVRFGTKTMNGTSKVALTVNGTPMPDSPGSVIGSTAETIDTGKLGVIYCESDGIDGKLDLGIDFTYSGVLYTARLDNIEVFYNRKLKLRNGQLYFYADTRSGNGFSIEGCDPQTLIWDVTDPVKPLSVEYQLDGSTAHFTATASDHREFVVFTPDQTGLATTAAGNVANQNLHGLPTPDMLIVTLPEYAEGAEKIADTHRIYDGMRVHVLGLNEIYNEFSGGKPDMGAIRRLLKMWYDRGTDEEGHRMRYALLMGKGTNDVKMVGSLTKSLGYNLMPLWETTDGLAEKDSYPCDSWLGMLDDVQPNAFEMDKGCLRVAVGRIPCKNASEAMAAARKVENYVANPVFGAWRNKVLVIADSKDSGVHYKQAQDVYNNLRSNQNGLNRQYDRLYLDTFEEVMTPTGPEYPNATAHLLKTLNDGVVLANYTGHANSASWGHEKIWTWPDIVSMSNANLPFMYAATCDFVLMDTPNVSAGETLVLNPDGGVISIITATRQVYINNNGELNRSSMLHMFKEDEQGSMPRWGDVFVKGQNFNADIRKEENNRLRYALVGDPALLIPGGNRTVNVTAIAGQPIDPEALPELAPMSSVKIEGIVADRDGACDTGFNGTVTLHLFDGETVKEVTSKNSSGGSVYMGMYNDHNSRLYTTTAQVTDGHWEALVRIPPEIQGLYNQALLSCYAWSDDGKEANGAFTDFYVYGYADESDDTEGPQIEDFYVNHASLGENAVVHNNMIVFATLTDESGINVSDSGIGHGLTLSIDGKKHITGLAEYFELDTDDPDTGRLVLPLNGVEPGRHTLTLSAWDNANNVSKAELNIEVGAALDPSILDINASSQGDTSSVDFIITTDRPNTDMICNLGVFDLSGRRIWTYEDKVNTGINSTITANWNLCYKDGSRVPRGIYIYRATIETTEGLFTSKSKKMAVSAAEGK